MANLKRYSLDLFTVSSLKKLPLTYHYMIKINKDEATELNQTKKFTKSDKHQTNFYQKVVSHKPVSILYE